MVADTRGSALTVETSKARVYKPFANVSYLMGLRGVIKGASLTPI